MKRKYRIVTNGEWYEIEYKYKLWPLWFRHKPNLWNYMDSADGYQPVDYDLYMFNSVEDAVKAIEELEKEEDSEVWETVITEPHLTDDGKITAPLVEGMTKSQIKQHPKVPHRKLIGQKPPAPQPKN